MNARQAVRPNPRIADPNIIEQPIRRRPSGSTRAVLMMFIVVIGVMTSRDSAADDFATTVMNATFKIYNPASTSTCFLVCGPRQNSTPFLATTAHTLDRMDGETAILVLRRLHEDGTYERMDRETRIRAEGKNLWTRHGREDVAVLRIKDDLPPGVTPLPVERLANTARLKAADVHICSPLLVFSYPERFEATPAGLPVARQGIFSSPPLPASETAPTFLSDFTTFAGDSGGPAFIRDPAGTPLIVGMVTGQHHFDESITATYETRKIHHPFNLGIVLHARYILETIELAERQDE